MQTVQVDGECSLFEIAISGVPLGTVLVPVILILHVNGAYGHARPDWLFCGRYKAL